MKCFNFLKILIYCGYFYRVAGPSEVNDAPSIVRTVVRCSKIIRKEKLISLYLDLSCTNALHPTPDSLSKCFWEPNAPSLSLVSLGKDWRVGHWVTRRNTLIRIAVISLCCNMRNDKVAWKYRCYGNENRSFFTNRGSPKAF